MNINFKLFKKLTEDNKGLAEEAMSNIEKELKLIPNMKVKSFLADPKIGGQGFDIIFTYYDKAGHPLFNGTYIYDGFSTGQVYFVDNIKHLIRGSISNKFSANTINKAEEYFINFSKDKNGLLKIIEIFDKITEAKAELEELKRKIKFI